MIYLDCDGVLLDLVTAFLVWHKKPKNIIWPKGEYDLTKATGFCKECFNNPAFWQTIKPHDSAQRIIGLVKEYAQLLQTTWGLVTIMPQDQSCIEIKKQKCLEYFNKEPIVLTESAKGVWLYEKGDILIDDSFDEFITWPNNIDRILVPRPWNLADGTDTDVVEKGLYRIFQSRVRE
jgi:hypothetical protein